MRKDKKKIFLFVRSPAASRASLMAKIFLLVFKNQKRHKSYAHDLCLFVVYFLEKTSLTVFVSGNKKSVIS